MNLLTTGIPRVDHVLGGGIAAGDVLLLTGPAGSGKTTLALQMSFNLAAHGEQVSFISTTSEPPGKLLAHAGAYTFFDPELIGSGLHIASIYPLIQQGMRPVLGAIEEQIQQRGSALLVLDGLMSLHDIGPDPRELRGFVYELGALAWDLGCAVVITSTRSDVEGRAEHSEFAMADALVRLSQNIVGSRTQRTLQVVKVRGQTPVLGTHTIRIDAAGLQLFHRFETLDLPPADHSRIGRISTGVSELDRMTGGGLGAGTITAVAGAPGTGKTVLGLRFLIHGAETGERGLLVSLREGRGELVQKARGLGLDLESALDSGTVVLLHFSPVDLSVDEAMTRLHEQLEAGDFQRLLVDDIEEMLEPVPEPVRRRAVVGVLSNLVRRRGLTGMVAIQVGRVSGPHPEFGRSPLDMLAQNLLLLRYVEHRGELHRILSILKVHDSGFDASIRRYEISPGGLRVLERTAAAEAEMKQIEKLESEQRTTQTLSGGGEE